MSTNFNNATYEEKVKAIVRICLSYSIAPSDIMKAMRKEMFGDVRGLSKTNISNASLISICSSNLDGKDNK